jgi:tetratricopeptide (TPR) repeat protein
LLSVCLNENKRPGSYSELLMQSGFRVDRVDARRSQHEAPVSEIVATARVLREQGRIVDAFSLLQENVRLRPNNPILLIAYGNLLRVKGNNGAAIDIFRNAIKILLRSRCCHDGMPYLDPFVNLFLVYNFAGKTREGLEVLSECIDSLDKSHHILLCQYWEFSIIKLYRGEIAESLSHLLIYFSRKYICSDAIAAFCLAILLMDRDRRELCDKCIDIISTDNRFDAVTAQYLCIIGSYASKDRIDKINNSLISPNVKKTLADLGESNGIGKDMFKIPMDKSLVVNIGKLLDESFLGGKYIGAIQ